MNARKCKAIRLGESLAVVLPKDWARGNEVEAGDTLDLKYDGKVSISVPEIREKVGEPDVE